MKKNGNLNGKRSKIFYFSIAKNVTAKIFFSRFVTEQLFDPIEKPINSF